MVLYKRKRVTFVPPPPLPKDLNIQVYLLKATGEWFYTYEEYLNRLDYYNSRKFVCEITGNSCLTYFQALESEAKEIKGVERDFPEALREHILRFLQFNSITRLDQLVDKVYSEFKNDCFPGETIYIKPGVISGGGGGNSKQKGTIREKVQYNKPDGSHETKYLVDRLTDMKQAIVTQDQISRDRNQFTKWLIKTFIKLTMSRSNKVGAPWVVKDKYAKKYRIPQVYPEHLKQFDPSYISPTQNNKKHERASLDEDGDLPPSSKKRKSDKKSLQKKAQKNAALQNLLDIPSAPEQKKGLVFPSHYLPDLMTDMEASNIITAHEKLPTGVNSNLIQPTQKTVVDDLDLKFDLQRCKPTPAKYSPPQSALYWSNIDGNDDDKGDDYDKPCLPEIPMQCALESWVFLNIYHRALFLDTFTFDEFMHAICWNKDQFNEIGRCELLDEIFCAALGAILSNDISKRIPGYEQTVTDNKGNEIIGLQVLLPKRPIDKNNVIIDDENRGSDTESEDNDKDESKSPNEPRENNLNSIESQTSGGSNGKIEHNEEDDDDDNDDNEDDDEEDEGENETDKPNENSEEEEEEEEEEEKDHNAYNLIHHRNTPWHERLRKRNFRDGNWQVILLGVFSLVEYVPKYQEVIRKVYQTLAPKDESATLGTVLNQFYESMDADLRLKTLNILIDLLSTGSVVRTFIDECLETSSTLRRDRLDNIRDFKVALEEAHSCLNKINDIVINKETSPNEEIKSEKKKIAPKYDYSKIEISPEEEALALETPELKKLYLERKKVLNKLEELKQRKKEIELKLVEMDCQRVKLLGKDRYCNRYWWFENNGLPTLHGTSNADDNENDEDEDGTDSNVEIEKDEISDKNYLMGKLWIQGPSKDDMNIRLETTNEEINEFKSKITSETSNPASDTLYENFSDITIKLDDEEMSTYYDEVQKLQEYLEVNYDNIPQSYINSLNELYGIKISGNKIFKIDKENKTKTLMIDHYGALWKNFEWKTLKPMERKLLEEMSDPLMDGNDWRYYDEPQSIDKLIKWLNPWGARESGLVKELTNAKEAIQQSMRARRNALWLDETPEDELELCNKIKSINDKIETLAKSAPSVDTSKNDQEVVETEVRTRIRRNASMKFQTRKRKKTQDEILKSGTAEELETLKVTLKEKLDEKRHDRELSRVLEWENYCARDKFDKSLYEGGDKLKKAKKGK